MMSNFLADEKVYQTSLKHPSSLYFSTSALPDGLYRGTPRPFCLPVQCAEENLFPEIRASAPAYFAAHGIKWHDGHDGKPSNHLCSSQVCGVNFLFPFVKQPQELAALLRPICPEIRAMCIIEDEQHVAFEWIGAKDYLGENPRGGKRTRGANFTSADAAVMFEREDGKKQLVLIEWKYTESYGEITLETSKSGTNRPAIYQHLFDATDCPLDKSKLPSFGALFFEPFYQFMRQQFLAHEMEKQHELGADIVSVLHIAPTKNTAFQKVTSPDLREIGSTAIDVWKALVLDPTKFISINTEKLFGPAVSSPMPIMRSWSDYITTRYPWVK